jgi:PIN domain nuclease of toxin-antitoxin system
MKYLLDTHTFIWMDSAPNQLSELARSLIQEPTNILLLSGVSIWEMQIKSQLGKLLLTLPLAELVESQPESNSIEIHK